MTDRQARIYRVREGLVSVVQTVYCGVLSTCLKESDCCAIIHVRWMKKQRSRYLSTIWVYLSLMFLSLPLFWNKDTNTVGHSSSAEPTGRGRTASVGKSQNMHCAVRYYFVAPLGRARPRHSLNCSLHAQCTSQSSFTLQSFDELAAEFLLGRQIQMCGNPQFHNLCPRPLTETHLDMSHMSLS